jgi:predicted phosphodiesterase
MAGKIYLTGDVHGKIDINKFNVFSEGDELDKEDYVIILGDFGILWKNIPDETEEELINFFDNTKYTTLFIDGNHENHFRLKRLNTKEMFGGTVGKVSESIYHLKRGEIYNICGKKFFTFGGAVSVDKVNRTENISWWKDEVASYCQFEYGLTNLDKNNNKVDYILSHTCPKDIVPKVTKFVITEIDGEIFHDPTQDFLYIVTGKVEFEKLYFGHFHTDKDMGKYVCMYDDIKRIV